MRVDITNTQTGVTLVSLRTVDGDTRFLFRKDGYEVEKVLKNSRDMSMPDAVNRAFAFFQEVGRDAHA